MGPCILPLSLSTHTLPRTALKAAALQKSTQMSSVSRSAGVGKGCRSAGCEASCDHVSGTHAFRCTRALGHTTATGSSRASRRRVPVHRAGVSRTVCTLPLRRRLSTAAAPPISVWQGTTAGARSALFEFHACRLTLGAISGPKQSRTRDEGRHAAARPALWAGGRHDDACAQCHGGPLWSPCAGAATACPPISFV